jgi:hypothetical protein
VSDSVISAAILNERLRVIEAEIQRLSIERALIEGWLSRAIPSTLPSIQGESVARLPLRSGGDASGQFGVFPDHPREPLTDRLVAFVRLYPGMSSAAIADGFIQESSGKGYPLGGKDPKKTIQTTLGALVSAGRLSKTPDGRHYAV